MHPLAAIGLVFLTGLAWILTVLTLLVSLAKTRSRVRTDGRVEVREPKLSPADVETAGK